jgi:hypothetical protein
MSCVDSAEDFRDWLELWVVIIVFVQVQVVADDVE